MASVALVLSILVPQVGNWWYGLTLASPAAAVYYFSKGERAEEVGGAAACLVGCLTAGWLVGLVSRRSCLVSGVPPPHPPLTSPRRASSMPPHPVRAPRSASRW
jgi:hypothetical protein